MGPSRLHLDGLRVSTIMSWRGLFPTPRFLRSILTASASAFLLAGCSHNPAQPTPAPIPEAPVISCPAAVNLMSPDGQPMSVVYGSATVTAGAPPVTDDEPVQNPAPVGNIGPHGDDLLVLDEQSWVGGGC